MHFRHSRFHLLATTVQRASRLVGPSMWDWVRSAPGSSGSPPPLNLYPLGGYNTLGGGCYIPWGLRDISSQLLLYLVKYKITTNMKFNTSCLLQDVAITLQTFISKKWLQNHFVAKTNPYKMVLKPLFEGKWSLGYDHNL